MNARIIAKMAMDFNGVDIVGRVYSIPELSFTFRVIVAMYVDGKRYMTSYDTIGGLHCARKIMMEMAMDLHGNH